RKTKPRRATAGEAERIARALRPAGRRSRAAKGQTQTRRFQIAQSLGRKVSWCARVLADRSSNTRRLRGRAPHPRRKNIFKKTIWRHIIAAEPEWHAPRRFATGHFAFRKGRVPERDGAAGTPFD